jgi:hypothetical protein
MTDLLRKHLAHRLQDLFDRVRVVVWRDPSGVLGPLVREALPSGVEMPSCEGNNPLSLRARIDQEDPWLEKKWLLYVRLPAGVECDWLADYEKAFCGLPEANLSWALAQFFGLRETPELRRILEGKAASTLALNFDQYFPNDPESLKPEDIQAALLRVAIKAPEADDGELVLRYLTSDEDTSLWSDLGLLPTLTATIKSKLGLTRHLADGHAPDRGALCRCMVASALVDRQAVEAKVLANHLTREEFRSRWRKALDSGLNDPARRPRLAEAIRAALHESDLLASLIDPMGLTHGPPLPILDFRIEKLLQDRRPEDITQLVTWWHDVGTVAEARRQHPGIDSTIRDRWVALHAAAALLELVEQRLEALVTYPAGAFDQLVEDYTRPEQGDFQIDALFRHIPQSEGAVGSRWEDTLVRPARQAYHKWTDAVAARLAKALQLKGTYAAPGFLRQTEFWTAMVDSSQHTAVLCVDAMRADLAYELARQLKVRGYEVETRPALAQLPTRTEVGMAALLPRADGQFSVKVEDGKVVSYIGATRLSNVEERKKHYASILQQQGISSRREEVLEFLKNDGALLAECATSNVLPVAYTLDLDEGGPTAAGITYQVFTESLSRCEKFIDCALRVGFQQVVVGADHGFLVRDPDAAGGGIPGTGGSSGGLARGLRYAAGSGQVSGELLHLTAAALQREGADVYVPRGTSCLAVQGGAGLFVHGGLSLQECALIFLQVRPGQGTRARKLLPLRLDVADKITGGTFKVTIIAPPVPTPLFYAARTVRVQLIDTEGHVVRSDSGEHSFLPGSSSHAATVVLTVPRSGTYTVTLLDAATSNVIQSLPVQVELLGDDFSF